MANENTLPQLDIPAKEREIARRESSALVAAARELVVCDEQTHEVAAQASLNVRERINWVKSLWKKPKDMVKDLDNWLKNSEKEMVGQFQEAERIIDGKILDYQDRKEKERQAEEAKNRAIQKKKDEDAKLAQAAALEEAGDPAAAQQVLDKPIIPVATKAPPPVQKVAGMSTRKDFDFEIIEPGSIPREWCKPDEVAIRAEVKHLGMEAEKKIPGIRVFEKRGLVKTLGRR